MKKIFSIFAVLFLVTCVSAGPWALYGSFITTGSTTSPAGGARYSLSSNICFDMAAGAKIAYKDSSANNFSVYVDAVFINQTTGVFVFLSRNGTSNIVPTFGAIYCLEHSITDKIALGCSPTLISYTVQKGNGIDLLSGVNVYTIITF
jgi:hypothetical protein